MIALLAATLLAQGDQSGQVDQSLNKTRDSETPRAAAKVEGPQDRPEMTSPEDAQTFFKVDRIRITGNRAIPTEELAPLVADCEGRRVSLADLRAAAGRISRSYADRGYPLAFAFVPAQEPKNGVFEIAVVEGRIDKILVGGNEHFSSEFILEHMHSLQGDETPSRELLERSLLTLSTYPGLSVHATFRPSDAPGRTDLYLSARDRSPIRAWLEYDNYGAEAVSESRFTAVFEAGNLFDVGHIAGLRVVAGRDDGELSFARVSYHAPFPSGIALSAYFSTFDYEADGAISPLEPAGAGDVFGVGGSYPFILRQDTALVGEVGLEWRNVDQELLGVTTSEDRLRVIVAGLRFERSDEGDWRLIAALQIRQGLEGFMGGLDKNDPDASRAGAGGGFTRATIQTTHVQRLFDRVTLVGRGLYQHGSEPLVSSEQIGIGGSDSVRGYPPFEFSGDIGWTASVEARFKLPVSQDLELVVFHDWARARRLEPAPGEARRDRLTAYGAGVRLNLPEWGTLRIEAGFPTAADPSDGDDPHVFVAVAVTIQ